MAPHASIVALFAAAASALAIIFFIKRRAPKNKASRKIVDDDSGVDFDDESELSQRSEDVRPKDLCDGDVPVHEQGPIPDDKQRCRSTDQVFIDNVVSCGRPKTRSIRCSRVHEIITQSTVINLPKYTVPHSDHASLCTLQDQQEADGHSQCSSPPDDSETNKAGLYTNRVEGKTCGPIVRPNPFCEFPSEDGMFIDVSNKVKQNLLGYKGKDGNEVSKIALAFPSETLERPTETASDLLPCTRSTSSVCTREDHINHIDGEKAERTELPGVIKASMSCGSDDHSAKTGLFQEFSQDEGVPVQGTDEVTTSRPGQHLDTWWTGPALLQVDGGGAVCQAVLYEELYDPPSWGEESEPVSELDMFGRLPPPYGYEETVTAFSTDSPADHEATFSPPHEFKDGVWDQSYIGSCAQDQGGSSKLYNEVGQNACFTVKGYHCSLYTHYEESETEGDSDGEGRQHGSPEPLLFDVDDSGETADGHHAAGVQTGGGQHDAGETLTTSVSEQVHSTERIVFDEDSTTCTGHKDRGPSQKEPGFCRNTPLEWRLKTISAQTNFLPPDPVVIYSTSVEDMKVLDQNNDHAPGAEYCESKEYRKNYSEGGGASAMCPQEAEETLSHVTEAASVMTPEEAHVLTAILNTTDHTLLVRALITVSNAAVFTRNQKLLRDAGCLKRLMHVLRAHNMALRVGQSITYPAIVTRVVNTVTNLAADEENQKQLQECIPALIDFAKSQSAPESVQVSSLQALINLSVTSAYHPPYTQLIQHLYECLDSGSHTLRLHALKVLINLSCNPEMVPHLLAAKAPGSLLAAIVPHAEEDQLLRWVTLLANVMWTAREKKLTNTSLPTEYKAPSPETMWTAIYGLNSSSHLRSKVFVLSKHRNQEIRYYATRIYSCLV